MSTKYRTRFHVQARNLSIRDFQPPKDFVLIGSDEISIAASREYALRVEDGGVLKATRVHHAADLSPLFLFDDLKNRFASRTKKQANGEICEYVKPVERGLSKAWELVN